MALNGNRDNMKGLSLLYGEAKFLFHVDVLIFKIPIERISKWTQIRYNILIANGKPR